MNANSDPDGFDVVDDAGAVIGAAVPHPRIEGAWMAMWKPGSGRDSGMKRYRTRRGAVAKVISIHAGRLATQGDEP